MKKLLTFAFATIFTIGLSVAQERGGRQGQNRSPEERAKMQVERLTKELELNKTQQDSIYNYFIQSMKKSTMQEVGSEQMKKSFEERNKKVKSFLTKDQVTKYEEMQKNMRARRPADNK